jgi:hypothetical protein
MAELVVLVAVVVVQAQSQELAVLEQQIKVIQAGQHTHHLVKVVAAVVLELLGEVLAEQLRVLVVMVSQLLFQVLPLLTLVAAVVVLKQALLVRAVAAVVVLVLLQGWEITEALILAVAVVEQDRVLIRRMQPVEMVDQGLLFLAGPLL